MEPKVSVYLMLEYGTFDLHPYFHCCSVVPLKVSSRLKCLVAAYETVTVITVLVSTKKMSLTFNITRKGANVWKYSGDSRKLEQLH